MPMWAMWAHFAATCVLFTVTGLVQWLRSGTRVPNSVGFFHPFTSDGGGGERVLWCAVRETQRARPDCQCVVYTGDDASGDELARRAQERFGVSLPSPPGVVKLKWRALVVPERYPVLTMVGQAIGGALLTAEAVTRYRPTVFFDTVGHAFGYPIARIAGCQVACYVHYPTISSDMIARREQKRHVQQQGHRRPVTGAQFLEAGVLQDVRVCVRAVRAVRGGRHGQQFVDVGASATIVANFSGGGVPSVRRRRIDRLCVTRQSWW